MATFESSLKPRLIYVFAINDEWHKDCLKIGETTLGDDDSASLLPNSEKLKVAASKRIDQYTKTAGIVYQLLYTEMTLFIKDNTICSFNDKQVHSVLERSGIKKKVFDRNIGANEWYCCDLETVKKAITAVKHGQTSLHPGDVTQNLNPIIFRPEQIAAIEKTKKQFIRKNQMLWNAKMRFGKTLCALQVAKDMEMKKTIIITHRPIVDDGWFEDFGKIFNDRKDYHYGSRTRGESFTSLERFAKSGDKYVYFASMQDMRGSEKVGGKFDKNNEVFSTTWDYLIVDEAHEGTKTELGTSVIKQLTSENTKVLRLSGTPFNLLDDYSEDEIYTWDYVMEQKAKADWDIIHMGDPNPYESLPAINIYTYDLGALIDEYADDEKAFNFREFFKTKDDGTFVHDEHVNNFLDLLCKEDKDSLYPYSNDKYRKIFRHTLWVLPGVKAAKALSAKLQNHNTFGNFKVVNVAGNGDEEEENKDALKMVNEAIGKDPDSSYTITLSCGRLTTGVSIKPWTAVFMMAGSYSTSAAQYMQTIFRVQTPFTHNGKMKEQCYAFDFAPDRTLRVLADVAKVSAKAGKTTEEDRRVLGEFLNFCPIISIAGSKMKPYNVKSMMGQLKKAQIEKVVQCGFEDGALYNDELLKLNNMDLAAFNNLKAKIGKTKAMPKAGNIDVNKQGFTNEEYEEKERLEKKKKKDRTPEEEARLEELRKKRNQRNEAISILRGISIRMPLMIYGADLNNENEDITIDNFCSIIDDKSWEEFMPDGVTKEDFNSFKKYYDPDIFREAGKRIRAMARAADKLPIEQRIERIAGIFNTFRNPDHETVLTPWRVVNMHMSDSLGGYCFYDKNFKQVLDEPRYVNHKGVTQKVFSSNSHILEINSKSGLYPLYAAYNIYRAKLKEEEKIYGSYLGQAFSMKLWDLTIENNILVVCKTPMARSITRRTLVGFRNTKVNANYYKDIIENISTKPSAVINTFRDGKRFWGINENENMKFDAIIGNPPYQVMDGGHGSSAKPLYHMFVKLAKSLNPDYISMIMPARWYAGGKGGDLVDFRMEMAKDNHLQQIDDYRNARECFNNVEIKGGICYFLWNKFFNDPECNFVSHLNGNIDSQHKRPLIIEGTETIIRFNEAISILQKVQKKDFVSFANIVNSRKPFGLPSNFRDYSPEKDDKHTVEIYAQKDKGYADPSVILRNSSWKDMYKVYIPEAIGKGDMTQDKLKPILGMPNTICSETYILIGPFKKLYEAKNVWKYIKTKFFHFMLGLKKNSQHTTQKEYVFVPMLNFCDNSIINWNVELRKDLDKQLYDFYELTDKEREFIERTINI